MSDIAKRTTAGADITHDHESCRAALETFAEIGATGFLAYRMQTMIPQNPGQPANFWRGRCLGPDPRRLGQHLLAVNFRQARFIATTLFLHNFHDQTPVSTRCRNSASGPCNDAPYLLAT
jgi:hypothetical protein